MIVAVLAGVVGYAIAHRCGRQPIVWAALAATVVLAPVVGFLGLLAIAAMRQRGALADRRRRDSAAAAEESVLVHVLLIAITGGLGLRSALVEASRRLSTSLQTTVATILRDSTQAGLGAALLSVSGPNARLFRQLGSAHLTGAPLALALTAFSHELHEQRRADAIARARQLPVRMVVPLTLLMLPGFLLLAIGPTVLASLERLTGPFTP